MARLTPCWNTDQNPVAHLIDDGTAFDHAVLDGTGLDRWATDQGGGVIEIGVGQLVFTDHLADIGRPGIGADGDEACVFGRGVAWIGCAGDD